MWKGDQWYLILDNVYDDHNCNEMLIIIIILENTSNGYNANRVIVTFMV